MIDLNVFPNPSSASLNVSFNIENNENAQLSIVDMTGKVVYNENVADGRTQINISALNSGVYYLRISSNNFVTAYPFTKN
jgi:hypothetical protein